MGIPSQIVRMVSPKSFALSTTLMFTPSMTTGGKSLSNLANEMCSSLHLSLFKDNLSKNQDIPSLVITSFILHCLHV